MMKKLCIFFLVLILVCLPFNSLSEGFNLSEMSTRELQTLKKAIQDELDARQTNASDSTLSSMEISDIGSFTLQEVIDTCKAISDRQTGLNSFDSFEVPIGTWTVGKNLYSGTYAISMPAPSFIGDFASSDYASINMNLSEYGKKNVGLSGNYHEYLLNHVLLSDGDTLEIDETSLSFSPGTYGISFEGANGNGTPVDISQYSDMELTQIYQLFISALANQQDIPKMTIPSGIWIVGRDIPVGTYAISVYCPSGSGNFSFSSDQLDVSGNHDEIIKLQSEFREGSIVIADGCFADLTVSSDEVFFGN